MKALLALRATESYIGYQVWGKTSVILFKGTRKVGSLDQGCELGRRSLAFSLMDGSRVRG